MLLVFGLISIFIFWLTSILISNFSVTSIDDFTIYGKSLDDIPLNLPEIEITFPNNGDSIYLSSELTIKGISSDTIDTNCTILTSINNISPFQNAFAMGLQGEQDFSNWNSTFFNVSNLLRPKNNTITSVIACLDTNGNAPTSSSHLINFTRLPSNDDQSVLSSVSRLIHESPENGIAEQHKSFGRSPINFQNIPHTGSVHHNNGQGQGQDQSQSQGQDQSQSQSTLSPNSGQSTTGNP